MVRDVTATCNHAHLGHTVYSGHLLSFLGTEEGKGPSFSRSRMRLIAVEYSTASAYYCHDILPYTRDAESILNLTLFVDL